MDAIRAITHALRWRVEREGTVPPQVRVAPDAHNPGSYLICIGDGGPTSFVTSWREGEPFTPEIADRWVEEYWRIQARPTPTIHNPIGIRARGSAELADILAYRIREHLGVEGDYRATLIPDRLAIQVEMLAPEYLRGLTFTFTGDELPLPIRNIMRNGLPNPFGGVVITETTPGITLNAPLTYNDIQRANYPTWPATGGIMTTATTATNAPALNLYRTPEQEVRFREYCRRYDTNELSPEQWTEYVNLGAMQACPTGIPVPVAVPPRPRIKVKVWRDDYREWQVSIKVGGQNRDLPTIAVIKSLLPPSDKHFLPSRQGRYSRTLNLLRVALNAGLSAQSLHDALRAWVVATEGATTNVESDIPILDEGTAALLNAMPATLEVGGKVYKLVPTKEIDSRPLIKRVRDRAITLAKVEGDAIRGRATTDARVVVREAESRAATLRAEVERERAAVTLRAPEWVINSGRPHCYRDGCWNVEMKVLCRVKEIRYTVGVWNRVLYWNPLDNGRPNSYYETWRMPVWVRLREGGIYTKDDISCKGFCSTHIESYMCMELQGLPPTLQSAEHLLSLEQIIGRGMQVVNLNSPLNTNVKRYWPAFLEQLPPVPIKLMTSGERADRYIIPGGRTVETWRAAYPGVTWDREELIEQEAATIFHVPEVGNATR